MDYDGSEKAIVVFDGYHNSTKDHEHGNRQGLGFTEIEVTENKKVMVSKSQFLLNSENKNGLIKLIIGALQDLLIEGEQATADADTLKVRRAIELSTQGAVNVVANDTDILVLLLHHRTCFKNFVYISDNEKSHDIFHIAAATGEEVHLDSARVLRV